MTPQQQARLGEIAVHIGTTQELLQQACSAQLANDMHRIIPTAAQKAIVDASDSINFAAAILLSLVQAQEVKHG